MLSSTRNPGMTARGQCVILAAFLMAAFVFSQSVTAQNATAQSATAQNGTAQSRRAIPVGIDQYNPDPATRARIESQDVVVQGGVGQTKPPHFPRPALD